MKKNILIAASFAAFSLVACKKTETTATDVNADSAATAVVVDNDSLPITSDSTVDAMDDKLEQGLDNAAGAVKEGANEVKDAAKDATDGDGDATR